MTEELEVLPENGYALSIVASGFVTDNNGNIVIPEPTNKEN